MQFNPDVNTCPPRFGLSWQFLPKTVLRLGYAHVFGPSQQAAGTIGKMGYRVDNTWVASIDGITSNDGGAGRSPCHRRIRMAGV